MAQYGTPLGVEAPGQTMRKRPKTKQASVSETRAALKALDERRSGESRRSHVPGRGTSQGDKSSLSAVDAASSIRNKKASDRKTIDEAG